MRDEVVAVSAVLSATDFLRTPVLAVVDPTGFKEWQHFVIHGRGCHVLVNFSLAAHCSADGHHITPRVVVIAHDDRWTGKVETYDDDAFEVSGDLANLVIGGNRMTVDTDGYLVRIELPGITGELRFTATSQPFVVNNQPVGHGRMCWLFVPRLRADGRLTIGDRDHAFDAEYAYHDHNWGRFLWGDDFGWTWGTILPTESDEKWSMVFLQMTDRRRLRFLSQALYVWYDHRPAAIFRHAAVTVRSHGSLRRPADCTLPPPMRLLLDGQVPGVPDRLEIDAARGDDTVHVEFRPSSLARLAHPSEVALDRVTVLCETGGTARMRGRIGGRDLDVTAAAMFEFLHG